MLGMRAVEATVFGLDGLRLVEKPTPRPGRGEILIRVKAASLNYRDLVILKGIYRSDLPLPHVVVDRPRRGRRYSAQESWAPEAAARLRRDSIRGSERTMRSLPHG